MSSMNSGNVNASPFWPSRHAKTSKKCSKGEPKLNDYLGYEKAEDGKKFLNPSFCKGFKDRIDEWRNEMWRFREREKSSTCRNLIDNMLEVSKLLTQEDEGSGAGEKFEIEGSSNHEASGE